MPEQFWGWLKKHIKSEWKLAFFSAVIIGFLTHLYIFVNRLPNHDSLINIYSPQKKFQSGRFFLGPSSGMSSFFDLPWINGAMAIFFLALFTVCLVELFALKKRLAIILVAGITVSFPTVTSTFAYMFTADGYMVGMFLAILSILVAKKFKYGFIPASLIVCLSVGIYQANLSIIMAFIILWIVREILTKRIANRDLLTYTGRYGLSVIIGMGLYYMVYKIYTGIMAGPITSYQGLDKVGSFPLSNIPDRIIQIVHEMKVFFLKGFIGNAEPNLFEYLNVLILIMIVVVSVYLFIKHKIYNNLLQTVYLVVLACALPFVYYVMYFLSPEVVYHMLMVYSMTSIYMFLVVIYDTFEPSDKSIFTSFSSWATIILLSLTVFNFAIIANIGYFNMELKVSKSTALANRIVDRIEQTEEYGEFDKFAVVGRVSMESSLSSTVIPNKIPAMTGMLGETFLVDAAHYKSFFSNYYGLSLEIASDEELEVIKATNAYQEMDIWPAQSSVEVIDNILIIKFKDE